MENALHVLEIIVGLVVTAVCCGAVPFAMRVTGELATIREEIKGLSRHEKAISDLIGEVGQLRVDMARLATNRLM